MSLPQSPYIANQPADDSREYADWLANQQPPELDEPEPKEVDETLLNNDPNLTVAQHLENMRNHLEETQHITVKEDVRAEAPDGSSLDEKTLKLPNCPEVPPDNPSSEEIDLADFVPVHYPELQESFFDTPLLEVVANNSMCSGLSPTAGTFLWVQTVAAVRPHQVVLDQTNGADYGSLNYIVCWVAETGSGKTEGIKMIRTLADLPHDFKQTSVASGQALEKIFARKEITNADGTVSDATCYNASIVFEEGRELSARIYNREDTTQTTLSSLWSGAARSTEKASGESREVKAMCYSMGLITAIQPEFFHELVSSAEQGFFGRQAIVVPRQVYPDETLKIQEVSTRFNVCRPPEVRHQNKIFTPIKFDDEAKEFFDEKKKQSVENSNYGLAYKHTKHDDFNLKKTAGILCYAHACYDKKRDCVITMEWVERAQRFMQVAIDTREMLMLRSEHISRREQMEAYSNRSSYSSGDYGTPIKNLENDREQLEEIFKAQKKFAKYFTQGRSVTKKVIDEKTSGSYRRKHQHQIKILVQHGFIIENGDDYKWLGDQNL